MKFCGSFSFTSIILVLIGLATPLKGHAKENQISINWSIPSVEVESLKERMNFSGKITPDKTTAEDGRGLPLVYVFIGIVSLPYLADGLISAVRKATCGGVIVDNTQPTLTITCNKKLNGMILRQKDGIEFKKFDSPPEPTELIGTLKNFLK